MNLIGQKINGQVVRQVQFYFSSKPPQEVIKALEKIKIVVNWVGK